MDNTSADPVPAIAEADATGNIAALYADIRATLGVPVVNLIWRHLASFPDGLSWAWETLKPLYASNAIGAEAAALRAGLEVPVLAGLSGPALAAAGVSKDDLTRITMILQSYERSNAMNMIAHGALLARLEGLSPAVGEPAPPWQNEAPIDGEMPALLTLDAMAPPVRALVEDLNRIGGRAEILASMYRHLAHWPAYLALIHALIAPFGATGRLEPLINSVIADGRRRASQIAGGLASPEKTPNEDIQEDLRAALAQFIDGPIGKMIAIVPLIRQAMPS
ncbi:MAG: hypothetical protein O7A08_07525 [SAR324 cluster bacterium]|nr:hypothetical protein [SAR324 cluster bacterium]